MIYLNNENRKMIPILIAGIVFGVGTAVGQKYGETVIIPAAKEAFTELRSEWNEFSDLCKTEWKKASEKAKNEEKSAT